MNALPKVSRHQTGFSIIEVLVTLVIMLLGLLGLVGMMLLSQRAQMESYQRSQALILLQDMVERINANRKVASCYAFTTAADGTPYLGSGSSITTPTCTAGLAEQNARAIQDMQDWHQLLLGSNEASGSGSSAINQGAMIGARGCVTVDTTTTPPTYQVNVVWQGLGKTAAPPAAWSCASDQYGSDTQRRVVGATVRIAKLS